MLRGTTGAVLFAKGKPPKELATDTSTEYLNSNWQQFVVYGEESDSGCFRFGQLFQFVQRPVDAVDATLATENRHRVEHPEPGRLAGQRDTQTHE